MRKIELGMTIYDERNGRFITVHNIRKDSNTANCMCHETEWDEETDEEAEVEYDQLFNINELERMVRLNG